MKDIGYYLLAMLALVLWSLASIGCGKSNPTAAPTEVSITTPAVPSAQCVTEMTFEVGEVNLARATVRATASKQSDDVRLTDYNTNSQWIVPGPGTVFELDLENHRYSIEGRAGGCRWSDPHLFSIETNPDNSYEPPKPEIVVPPVEPPVVPPTEPEVEEEVIIPPRSFSDSFCTPLVFDRGVAQTRTFFIPAGDYTLTVTTYDEAHVTQGPNYQPLQDHEKVLVFIGGTEVGTTIDIPTDAGSQVTTFPWRSSFTESLIRLEGSTDGDPNIPNSVHGVCVDLSGVLRN